MRCAPPKVAHFAAEASLDLPVGQEAGEGRDTMRKHNLRTAALSSMGVHSGIQKAMEQLSPETVFMGRPQTKFIDTALSY